MIIDGHIHFFDHRIIANVSRKPAMVEELGLETNRALERIGREPLKAAGRRAGLDFCLYLPAVSLEGICAANDESIAIAAEKGFIRTAGTLHPALEDLPAELEKLQGAGIRAIKISTFSQRFSLEAAKTADMFRLIEGFNKKRNAGFFIVADTYFKADFYFGAPRENVTTPGKLGRLVADFPGIVFVAAHMGGLTAPPEAIFKGLAPASNLYLDTSNAAHTLDAAPFCRLLTVHGPERIIFGTDWPWFDPGEEIKYIDPLMSRAGFSRQDKSRVLGENMARLLGI